MAPQSPPESKIVNYKGFSTIPAGTNTPVFDTDVHGNGYFAGSLRVDGEIQTTGGGTFGFTMGNNEFLAGLTTANAVKRLIGVNSSNVVSIDPDAIGAVFGGTLSATVGTFSSTLTATTITASTGFVGGTVSATVGTFSSTLQGTTITATIGFVGPQLISPAGTALALTATGPSGSAAGSAVTITASDALTSGIGGDVIVKVGASASSNREGAMVLSSSATPASGLNQSGGPLRNDSSNVSKLVVAGVDARSTDYVPINSVLFSSFNTIYTAGFSGWKSHGGSFGTLGAVGTDEALVQFTGRGAASGSAWDDWQAGMYILAGENHSASNQGKYVQIRAVANGATTQTNVARFDSTGLLPEVAATFTNGSATLQWLGVYSRSFVQQGANAQAATIQQATTTVAAATAGTLTASNLIPAGSLVLGVTLTVTTTFSNASGLTTFSIGDGTDTDRWGATFSRTAGAGTTLANITITSPVYYTSATSIVLTADAGTFNSASGVARITVSYVSLTAATS